MTLLSIKMVIVTGVSSVIGYSQDLLSRPYISLQVCRLLPPEPPCLLMELYVLRKQSMYLPYQGGVFSM